MCSCNGVRRSDESQRVQSGVEMKKKTPRGKTVKDQRATKRSAGRSASTKRVSGRTGRAVATTPARKKTPVAAVPSLYDRLGGVYSIAVVVDHFVDRVMADPRLNPNAKVDEAHDKVPPAGFKYLVTEQVCWATGGPQTYTGRSMRDSHAHLEITEFEWQSFLDDLHQTFDK